MNIDWGELAHREKMALEAGRARDATIRHCCAQRDRGHVSAVRAPHGPLRGKLGAIATGLARDALDAGVFEKVSHGSLTPNSSSAVRDQCSSTGVSRRPSAHLLR